MDCSPRVGVALEPLHPEDSPRRASPLVQLLVERVDVDEQVARRGGAGRSQRRSVDSVGLVIETERIFLVDQDQVVGRALLPQPFGDLGDVFAVKAAVVQVGVCGCRQPGCQCGCQQHTQQATSLGKCCQPHCHQRVERRCDKTCVPHVECVAIEHGKIVERQAPSQPGQKKSQNGPPPLLPSGQQQPGQSNSRYAAQPERGQSIGLGRVKRIAAQIGLPVLAQVVPCTDHGQVGVGIAWDLPQGNRGQRQQQQPCRQPMGTDRAQQPSTRRL